jgi:hypothetical protein
MLVPRTRGASSSRPPHPADQIRAPQTEIGTLRHAEGPHSCLSSSPVPAMASGPRTSRSVRHCSAVSAVATDDCYRVPDRTDRFRPQKWPFHAQSVGGEAGIRTQGACALRFSRVLQSGRAGPSAFDLSVRVSDLAPVRSPPFAGEDASEAAANRWSEDQLGGATGLGRHFTSIHPRPVEPAGRGGGVDLTGPIPVSAIGERT